MVWHMFVGVWLCFQKSRLWYSDSHNWKDFTRNVRIKNRAWQLRLFTVLSAKHHWQHTVELIDIFWNWQMPTKTIQRLHDFEHLHTFVPQNVRLIIQAFRFEWSVWVTTSELCAAIMRDTELQHTVAVHLTATQVCNGHHFVDENTEDSVACLQWDWV